MLIAVDIYEDTTGTPFTLPYPQEDVTPALLDYLASEWQGCYITLNAREGGRWMQVGDYEEGAGWTFYVGWEIDAFYGYLKPVEYR